MPESNSAKIQHIISEHDSDIPTLTAITAAIRRYLVVQPRPHAADTAKAAFFPWLYVLGHDLWHPQTLRQADSSTMPRHNFCRYHLEHDNQSITVDVWGVGESLSRSPARDIHPRLHDESDWALRTNGSDWQFSYLDGAANPQRYSFSLFDENFQEVMYYLLDPNISERDARVDLVLQALSQGMLRRAMNQLIEQEGKDILRDKNPAAIRELLQQKNVLERHMVSLISSEQIKMIRDFELSATNLGFIRTAQPLSAINLEDIQHHARMVNKLRGNLQATFDEHPIDISSRTGFYYILAAIAVQFRRQDAIPVADLIRPPDTPPDSNRVRPLGKPGWYLNLNASAEELDESVSTLLDMLNLRHRFKASNRGEPFPAPDPLNI